MGSRGDCSGNNEQCEYESLDEMISRGMVNLSQEIAVFNLQD